MRIRKPSLRQIINHFRKKLQVWTSRAEMNFRSWCPDFGQFMKLIRILLFAGLHLRSWCPKTTQVAKWSILQSNSCRIKKKNTCRQVALIGADLPQNPAELPKGGRRNWGDTSHYWLNSFRRIRSLVQIAQPPDLAFTHLSAIHRSLALPTKIPANNLQLNVIDYWSRSNLQFKSKIIKKSGGCY